MNQIGFILFGAFLAVVGCVGTVLMWIKGEEAEMDRLDLFGLLLIVAAFILLGAIT